MSNAAEQLKAEVKDRADQEADGYRGEKHRPLGGYVVVLCVYSFVVGVTTLIAVATGRRLPERWHLQDLITVALGTHKLSRTLTKDAVTSPLRAPFTRYAGTGGPAEVHEEVRSDSQFRHSMGELLTCPFCLDMWVATGFVIGLVFAPRFTRLVAGSFSALTGADFLQLAYAMAQQASEH
jgi:hypothetical protein